jgi:hypothetical protein
VPRSAWIWIARLAIPGTVLVGARVTVTAGDLTQIDEIHSGRSYQSDFGRRLHFGLGRRSAVEQIRVNWIGGSSDLVRNVGVDRLITIVEGRGLESPPAPTKRP